jgi:ribosomal protein S21
VNPEVITQDNQHVDEALRILARMISKAILKEREEQRLKESESVNNERKPIPNSTQNSS